LLPPPDELAAVVEEVEVENGGGWPKREERGRKIRRAQHIILTGKQALQ
jgi:hypothetical protein